MTTYRINVEIIKFNDDGDVEECGEAWNFGDFTTEEEAVHFVDEMSGKEYRRARA